MEFGPDRKRGKPEGAFNANGGFKKFKQEMESFPTGTGSKSKPCTKFFSTTGCQFGEGCHFLHYVPGGIKAVTQILGSNPALPSATRNPIPPPPFAEGPSPPTVKTRMCNKYNTAEGCRFGDKCHFAHGEGELVKSRILSYEGPRGMMVRPPMGGGRLSGHMEPPPAGSFGASATAKISVNASLSGAIIGKGGANSKQICRVTGAKLSIRDHESNPDLKNIELEGSFDQIKQASAMVREIIMNSDGSASGPPPPRPPPPMAKNPPSGPGSGSASGFKTKLCVKFAKGTCTFGDRCHYAHGADELRT